MLNAQVVQTGKERRWQQCPQFTGHGDGSQQFLGISYADLMGYIDEERLVHQYFVRVSVQMTFGQLDSLANHDAQHYAGETLFMGLSQTVAHEIAVVDDA